MKSSVPALLALCLHISVASAADVFIPDVADVDHYWWTRGCSPSAAAMVLSYADNRFINYTGLVRWYKVHETSGYNVSQIVDWLATDMSTDSEGGTSVNNLSVGIKATANDRCGYNFDSRQVQSGWFGEGADWCWGLIKSEVDAGRPFVWSVTKADWWFFNREGHSLAAVGYDPTYKEVIVRDSNYSGLQYWRYNVYEYTGQGANGTQVDTVERAGGYSAGLTLDSLLSGGTINGGQTYTVWWYHHGNSAITKAALALSSDRGRNWSFITGYLDSSPGWNSYQWPVPNTAGSNYRLRIYGYDSGNTIRAGDGSRQDFSVQQTTTSTTTTRSTTSTTRSTTSTTRSTTSTTQSTTSTTRSTTSTTQSTTSTTRSTTSTTRSTTTTTTRSTTSTTRSTTSSTRSTTSTTRSTTSTTIPGGKDVALFQNQDPWGSTRNQAILSTLGKTYDVLGDNAMGTVNLSQYTKVIIASQQPRSFYQTLSANRSRFNQYVQNGGVLQFHGAAWTEDRWGDLPMPGGLTVAEVDLNALTIAAASHALVNNPNVLNNTMIDNWNSSTHGYFTGAAFSYTTVIREDQHQSPVLLVGNYGSGSIIATMMTVEFSGAPEGVLQNLTAYLLGGGAFSGAFDGGANRKYLAWFGWYNDQHWPWIWDYQFGDWLWVVDNGHQNVWFWRNDQQRWMWTRTDWYRWVWYPGDAGLTWRTF